MDRIAIISDIHGNLPALQATLEDISSRAITRIFCLGDLVGKGPHSDQAVDICRAVCETIVRGNWDDFIGNPTDVPVLRWHQQRLGRTRLDYLASLPMTVELMISGRRVRLFHASQQSVHYRVHMDDTPEKQLAMFDNTPLTGHGPVPDVVGYGDIHRAYLKTLKQGVLFNAGSVGNPLDLTQASYAILEGQYGRTQPGPFAIQLIRVPYDIERAIRDAEAVQMPQLDLYSAELRTARYRGAP